MTDNTQELDEILDGFARAVRVVVVNGLSHDKYERRQKDFKQAIIEWHNKQVEAVLDRLEAQSFPQSNTNYIFASALQAERAKLKEVK